MKINEDKLKQVFENFSDCYADTGWFENDGSYTEGEVILAMTKGAFIKALAEVDKLIKKE